MSGRAVAGTRTDVTYPELGATRTGPLPPGYRHLVHRTLLGSGPAVLVAAAEALLSWQMHRAAGVLVQASGPRAVPGVTVRCGLGTGRLRLWVPCRVVWTETAARRAGFGYGTLFGHFTCGEEAFMVSHDADDRVWFEVRAFSRPVRWWARLAGPVVPLLQRQYARRCGAALRRLSNPG